MLKYFWNIMSKSVSVGRVSLLVWLPSRREKACLFFMTRLCAFGREGEPFLYRDRKPARGVVHPQKSEYVRKGNVYKKRSTTHRGCGSRKESQPTTVNTAGAVWRCHSGKKPLSFRGCVAAVGIRLQMRLQIATPPSSLFRALAMTS